MRRLSPPRPIRRRSPPPRRRGRLRSLSPLSRSQPAPPGEEHGRKFVPPWDGQPRNKRPRSRSREWIDRSREPLDRDPPFTHPTDNGRPKRREVPRDKSPKNRTLDKSAERNRERERPLNLPRDVDLREKEKHHHRRHSPSRIHSQLEDFEESYLDNQPHHYANNSGLQKPFDNTILDPSSITFNAFVPEHPLKDKPRDMPRDMHRQLPRSHHQPPRDIHNLPPRAVNPVVHGNNKEPTHHKKEESSADRIKRLEKLVEKLVANNASSEKPGGGYQPAKDIIPELIPSNSKITTSIWLNCIHQECLKRNYDEKSSIRFMQDKMTGIMKAWFKTVSHYDFTWPELRMLITKTFPDNIEFAQTLKHLVSRDKTGEETITQYFFSKVYLCEACKITGENAVSCLIDGLNNPFMKQDIKSLNFLTPEALYSEYLAKFPENEIPVHMDRRDIREVVPEYHNEEYIPLEVGNKEQRHHREDRFENRPPGQPPFERKKCFTCNKFGHLTVDCRHAPICYKCQKKGHIAAKCHFNNALLLISSVNFSSAIPQVGCSINGQRYFGIIDTGCNIVAMKKRIAQDLKLMVTPTFEVIMGYGDKTVVPFGETKVFLTVGSAQRFVRVLVVENEVQHVPIIIGQEFLSQDGVVFWQKDGEINILDAKNKEI